MSSIYGITGTSGTSLFDSMFGTSSSTSTSSSGISLSDYALLRSGAYKKLISAYYAESDSSAKTETEVKAEKLNLQSIQTEAKSLAKSASALSSATYDEDGREEIVKNIKSLVENYNSMLDAADEVEDTTVLRNMVWLTKQTEANSDLLSEVGITIGEGNSLSIDEDKLSSANLSTLKTLFYGSNSYASYIMQKGSQIYSAAAGVLNASKTGSAYTSSGKYAATTVGNLVDSKY